MSQGKRARLLHHLLVAADESDASRGAIDTALQWANRAHARVTILTVVPEMRPRLSLGTAEVDLGAARGRFARWVGPELVREPMGPVPKIVAVLGIPSVEIARFAEERGVDLLVLGRKPRAAAARLLVGDTADAVARRSPVPCLFVPAPLDGPKLVLVALDGSARALAVFLGARNVVEGLGGRLTTLAVEPPPTDPRRTLPHFRSSAGIENLRKMLEREGNVLRVRHGDVVEEILADVSAIGASVLAVGYHRGGAPGVVDTGSVARRLVHAAPCVVLTIPL